MALSDFLDRVLRRRTEDLTSRADRAGKAGVEAARKVVPVRTGRLRDSIHFIYTQSDMTLVLIASAPYAADVARRNPFIKAGAAAMRAAFSGNTAVQFDAVPEKYQARARLLAGPGTIIGHRSVRKTR